MKLVTFRETSKQQVSKITWKLSAIKRKKNHEYKEFCKEFRKTKSGHNCIYKYGIDNITKLLFIIKIY